MKTFEEFLAEAKVTIDSLKGKDRLFVILIGGSAVGKNYTFEKHFPSLPMIDIDQITYKLTGGDFEKRDKVLSKAIKMAGDEIDKYLKTGESFGQVTVGGGTKAVQNKINKAHDMGYEVALVLVDVDADTAIKRMRQRAKQGKQSSIPEWKVIKTNERARETYRQLKADYNIKVKN